MFYVLDITRLPPVGMDHVDISAILQELMLLQQEVHLVSELCNELDELKSMMLASVNAHKQGHSTGLCTHIFKHTIEYRVLQRMW